MQYIAPLLISWQKDKNETQKYNQNTLKYTSNKKVSNIHLVQLLTWSVQNLFLFFIGE